MSAIVLNSFRGTSPQISPRALPIEMAVDAVNARLLSGDLEAYKDFESIITLAKTPPFVTIFELVDKWLQFTEDELSSGAVMVDVVFGPIPGDTTHEVFITGLDVPRFTNYDLATNEIYRESGVPVGAYPYRTEVLGIEAPIDPTSVVQPTAPAGPTVAYAYDGSTFAGWGQNFYDNGAGSRRRWVVDNTVGTPPPGWLLEFAQNPTAPLYTTTPFSLSTASQFTATFDVNIDDEGSGTTPDSWFSVCSTFDGYRAMLGPYVGLSVADGRFFLNNGSADIDSQSLAVAASTWYLVSITGVADIDSSSQTAGFVITATVADSASPSTILATVTGFVPYSGEQFACNANHRGPDSDSNIIAYDHVVLTISQPPPAISALDVEYTYTEVNSFGQESAPAPVSDLIVAYLQIDSNGNVLGFGPVTGSIPPYPVGQDVVSYNLYRSGTTASGTSSFFFAQQLPASSAHSVDWTDSLLDSQLGDELTTTLWSPPRSDMRGLISLPNGIMAGFSRNRLCLSVKNFPHAWPRSYELTTDYPIVGLGAIDTAVVVLTEGPQYFASGTDPSAFQMDKDTFIQGCTSKPSIVFLRGVGVVFASPEGICSYAGLGTLRVVTKDNLILSERDWEAYNPASIVGFGHESYYYFFYDTGSVKGGFVLDFSQNGFGLIELDFHARAGYVDTLTDTLYLVLDSGEIKGVAVEGDTVFAWNKNTSTDPLRPYTWFSKLFQLPLPTCYLAAQIRALDYDDLTLQLYADGNLIFTTNVTSEQEFTIPTDDGDAYTVFQFKLTGTSRVTQVQFAESMEELQ